MRRVVLLLLGGAPLRPHSTLLTLLDFFFSNRTVFEDSETPLPDLRIENVRLH
jgi:hypothetical protein